MQPGSISETRQKQSNPPFKCNVIFYLFFCLLIPLTGAFAQKYPSDNDHVRIGITDIDMPTARVQAISGDFRVRLLCAVPASASEPLMSQETQVIINEGEDMALMVSKKGIIARPSQGQEYGAGYDRVDISGGRLLSVEIPTLKPIVLKSKCEFLLNDEGGLLLVNTLPLKEYLISAVSQFTYTSEPEAIKALTVLARTRAISILSAGSHASESFDLCSSEHCLPFRGCGENRDLVEMLFPSTAGEVIFNQGKIPFPRYCDCCGGKISSARDIFGQDEPIHQSKDDRIDDKGSENCFHSPSFYWAREFTNTDISDFITLAFAGGGDRIYLQWNPVKIDKAGRITEVYMRGRREKTVSGVDFMNKAHEHFGENSIKSMRFTMEPMRRATIYRGMGSGHGVGMCLYGADGMAKKRFDYKAILKFYFSNITIGSAQTSGGRLISPGKSSISGNQ